MCVIYTGTILYVITITFKAQPTKAGLKPAAVSSSALVANCEDSEETFHKIVLFSCQLQHLTNRAPHRPGPRHAPCTAIATFPLYTAGKQARLINWRNQGNKGVAGTPPFGWEKSGNSSTSLCLNSQHSPCGTRCLFTYHLQSHWTPPWKSQKPFTFCTHQKPDEVRLLSKNNCNQYYSSATEQQDNLQSAPPYTFLWSNLDVLDTCKDHKASIQHKSWKKVVEELLPYCDRELRTDPHHDVPLVASFKEAT